MTIRAAFLVLTGVACAAGTPDTGSNGRASRDSAAARSDTPRRDSVAIPADIARPDPDCQCTMEFRILTIHIVNPDGSGVRDANLVIRSEATGEVVARRGPPMDGSEYGLFDDSSLPQTAPDGDWFVIDITAGTRRASARQRLGRTQPCSCHIERKSGPQRVVLP